MKTNQVLIRKMGNFDVSQRTKDGMFNATLLIKQWNEQSGQQKKLDHFFENKSTKEFITALISEENLNTQNSVYLKSEENLNRGNSPYLTTRGKNGGTWMHPYLFVKFAMWLNPRFEVKVIKFVYDELIKYRNDAGDAFREMSSAISKIVEKNFMQAAIKNIAKAVNHIVFGAHEPEIRNKQAEEVNMRELFELERKVSSLINEGFINSYEQLIGYLRRLWAAKWQPKVLSV